MTRNRIAATAAPLASIAALLWASPAWAQEEVEVEVEETPQVTEEAEYPEPKINVGPFSGLAATIGGGIVDFTDDQVRDFTDLGGAWEARGVLGARSMWAVEGAYVGSAQDVEALGLDEDAVLIGTGFELLGRFNFVQVPVVTPYAAIGLNWTHYDVSQADFNTSALSSSDSVWGIPIAVGVSFGLRGPLENLFFDLRGSLRPTFDSDLVDDVAIPEDEEARLDTWSLTGRLGWVF